MEEWLRNWDYEKTWFHDSPVKLSTLTPGTTITQNLRLAEVFSHKPQWVTFNEDGTGPLKHSGHVPGWLYIIDEPLGPTDIYPHPRTVMNPDQEWLTRRELRVRLIGPVTIDEQELLSPREIRELEKRRRDKGKS